MKKILSLLLAALLLLSLAACSAAPQEPTSLPRADWPLNEFTQRLPVPVFEVTDPTVDGDMFTATFKDASIRELKAYVEELKAAGFDQDIVVEDENLMGIAIYTFGAKNAEGWQVSVASAMGLSDLILEKP